mmetsp:Transcript_37593/g.111554  ORF Transcript_37593/g.111554 Transcript_37593/m.111554 type:complete len:255 (+) Transcript_37593:1354-2118(+)
MPMTGALRSVWAPLAGRNAGFWAASACSAGAASRAVMGCGRLGSWPTAPPSPPPRPPSASFGTAPAAPPRPSFGGGAASAFAAAAVGSARDGTPGATVRTVAGFSWLGSTRCAAHCWGSGFDSCSPLAFLFFSMDFHTDWPRRWKRCAPAVWGVATALPRWRPPDKGCDCAPLPSTATSSSLLQPAGLAAATAAAASTPASDLWPLAGSEGARCTSSAKLCAWRSPWSSCCSSRKALERDRAFVRASAMTPCHT